MDNSEVCFLVDGPGLPSEPVLESFCFAIGFVWFAFLSLWQGLMLLDDKGIVSVTSLFAVIRSDRAAVHSQLEHSPWWGVSAAGPWGTVCHSIPSGSRACFLLLSPGPSPSVPPIFRVTLPSIVKPS